MAFLLKKKVRELEMDWLLNTFRSSIGKKLIMAITGLSFCSFLGVHLLGNLTIYGGSETFNAYSDKLHAFGALLTAVEWGLLFFALLHVCIGALLYFQNLLARPQRYVMKKTAGGRTWSSMIMPYTGLYLLVFVIIHLFTFHFVDRGEHGIFAIVAQVFHRPGYVVFYLFSMLVAAFHIKHGFWSAFQSIGANHPKYMPLIRAVGVLFSVAVVLGFGSVPVFVLSGT